MKQEVNLVQRIGRIQRQLEVGTTREGLIREYLRVEQMAVGESRNGRGMLGQGALEMSSRHWAMTLSSSGKTLRKSRTT
jgi:hypothetical protein